MGNRNDKSKYKEVPAALWYFSTLFFMRAGKKKIFFWSV